MGVRLSSKKATSTWLMGRKLERGQLWNAGGGWRLYQPGKSRQAQPGSLQQRKEDRQENLVKERKERVGRQERMKELYCSATLW